MIGPKEVIEWANPDDSRAAHSVAEKYGGLAGAIELAATTIETLQLSVDEFLNELQKCGPVEVAEDMWQGGLKKVKDSIISECEKISADEAAADLLNVCAHCAPEPIPDVVLLRSRINQSPEDSSIAKLGGLIQKAGSNLLIERDSEKKTVSIPPLVQACLKGRLTEEEQQRFTLRVFEAIEKTIVDVPPRNRASTKFLLQHALVVARLFQDKEKPITVAPNKVGNIGKYLHQHKRLEEAEALFLWTVRSIRHDHSIRTKRLVEYYRELAILQYRQHRFRAAMQDYYRVETIVKHHNEEDNPKFIHDWENMAVLLKRLSRHDKALKYKLRAHEVRVAHGYKYDPTEMVECLQSLGECLSDGGDRQWALILLNRAEQIIQDETVPELNQANIQQMIGKIYEQLELYEKAYEYLSSAMDLYEEIRSHSLVTVDCQLLSPTEPQSLLCVDGKMVEITQSINQMGVSP